jgi:glycosyltransferase involved in cell wall biosynthesis
MGLQTRPSVSIIIPAYESHQTIAGCLEALRVQTWQDFEIVVVDSSAHDDTQEIIAARFPEVRYIRQRHPLLPFAARQLAIQSARGEIIVSTDPDVYPARDWLERLVRCHNYTGYAIAGSVTCYGARALDWGAHFCKYHESLPYRAAGPVRSAASANLLFTREMYEAVSPISANLFSSDYLFTLALVTQGYTIWFEPCALVSHHHLVTWRNLIAERYRRGKDFGEARVREMSWSKRRLMVWLGVSILPIRLAHLLIKTGRTAQRGGVVQRYLWTQPAVALGFASWLAGESAAYAKALVSIHSSRD